jgi:hypothetical protein
MIERSNKDLLFSFVLKKVFKWTRLNESNKKGPHNAGPLS